jgi:thymidylate synthase (FAD)|tara:strand:+ start:2553 stop:3182 length:630 start_codon:yes stop_codon:yes gene_type:complete
MSVSLVWATPDAEKLIVKMARVSNKSNEDNWETGPKLLKYLIKHKHWSPFEMASMCVQIDTERDIASQLTRHRSFSFQEFSTRYAKTKVADTPWFRRQDETNRQSSHNDIHPTHQDGLQKKAGRLIADCYFFYDQMLQAGVAKETARRILPLCTPTSMYMVGTLRSWLHYIDIRAGEETQLEHRLIARKCLSIFKEQFPIVAEAAFDNL